MSQQKTIYEKWEEGGITILTPNPIVKLVYKSEFFDIEAMKIGERTVTIITSDGIITRKKYSKGTRKPYSTQTIAHRRYGTVLLRGAFPKGTQRNERNKAKRQLYRRSFALRI